MTRAPDPIGIFYAAHQRLRRGCEAIRVFCEDPDLWTRRDYAEPLYRYFAHELPLVFADEEERLLPALARHLRGDPCFEELAGRIAIEHARGRRLGPDFLRSLGALAHGGRITDGFRFSTRGLALARASETHADFEDREVLPLARRFLDSRDREWLAQSMRCLGLRGEAPSEAALALQVETDGRRTLPRSIPDGCGAARCAGGVSSSRRCSRDPGARPGLRSRGTAEHDLGAPCQAPACRRGSEG